MFVFRRSLSYVLFRSFVGSLVAVSRYVFVFTRIRPRVVNSRLPTECSVHHARGFFFSPLLHLLHRRRELWFVSDFPDLLAESTTSSCTRLRACLCLLDVAPSLFLTVFFSVLYFVIDDPSIFVPQETSSANPPRSFRESPRK